MGQAIKIGYRKQGLGVFQMSATEVNALRVAGIGAGYFAQFHYDAWRRLEGASLVAVADRVRSKAEGFGGVAYGDPAAMLAAERPDIVDIVTPPGSHLAMIELALKHGVKAIICQKPFCGDLESARAAVVLAEAAGTPLIVHENFRFQPWYRALKREIDAGRVSELLQVTFRLRPGDGQGPEAYLSRQPGFQKMRKFLIHETGVHWIDTFRFLVGEPDSVYADLRQLNDAIAGEDAGIVIFGYPGGLRCLFDGNRLADHPAEDHRRTMGEGSIEGTAGEIRLRGDGSLHFRAKGALTELEIFASPPDTGFGGDCVAALQAHVIAGLKTGSPFENSGRDYLRNLEVEEAVYQAADRGQKIEL